MISKYLPKILTKSANKGWRKSNILFKLSTLVPNATPRNDSNKSITCDLMPPEENTFRKFS